MQEKQGNSKNQDIWRNYILETEANGKKLVEEAGSWFLHERTIGGVGKP